MAVKQMHQADMITAPKNEAWIFWSQWTLATAIGEFVGFGLVMTLGGITYVLFSSSLDNPTAWVLGAAALVAGFVEGSALGVAQWVVVRCYVHDIPPRQWMLATVSGTIIAYTIGMTVGSYSGNYIDLSTVNPITLVGAGVLYVAILGAILGTAQWLVLRNYIKSAGWWIPANVAAWLVGLAVGFAGPALIQDWNSIPLVIAVGAATGVLMGALVGAITGLALVRLLRNQL